MAALHYAPMNQDSLAKNPDLVLPGSDALTSQGSNASRGTKGSVNSLRTGSVDAALPKIPSKMSMTDSSGHSAQRDGASELQHTLRNDIDSVYSKFRISLACTTLVELTEGPGINVIWFNKKSHLHKSRCTVS